MKINRERIAVDALLCRSIAEVCQRNDISECTYYRMRKEPEFLELVRQQKERLFHEAASTLRAVAAEAVSTLRDIAGDTNAPASARVSAAGKLLDMGQSVYDLDDMASRLDVLERRAHDKENGLA